MDFDGKWEKRWHPLRQEWVVYAAHRNTRPWTTGTQQVNRPDVPAYDPTCYLCPGNARVHGVQNPDYQGVFVFDNDHPVVGLQAPAVAEGDGLYRRSTATGIARVICYDPRHNLTLADLQTVQVANVFAAWREQMREMLAHPSVRYVLIFENKGELCGVSNPHPHGQLYATDFVFRHCEQHLQAARDHRQATGTNIFAQIIESELADGRRVVVENSGAVAFVPFFARYAYETMVFPKHRHATLATMTDSELYDLAAVFQALVRRYDRLFGFSFPYVMSVQQAPVDGADYSDYHLHLSLLPPLRQPGLVKHLAGPEIGGGNFMADTLPEEKAAELRNLGLKG